MFLKKALILISAIPELLRLIKELRQFVTDYNERKLFKQKMQDLELAIHEARQTKDTTKLEEFFAGQPSKGEQKAEPNE